MATVRLSNDKRDGIVNRFTNSLQPAFDAEWSALVKSVDHERFIDTFIEVWIRHEGCYACLETMPRKWFEEVKEIRLGEINGVSSYKLNRLETPCARVVPFFMCRKGEKYGGNVAIELNDPDLDELALKMLEFNEVRESIDKRKADAERTIHKLVYECQTVKQLLDVWPAAAGFVSAADMDEHHRVPTKTPRGGIAISEETLDTLNAGAVMGALASAARR